jgi:hypothetical protein
MHQSCLYLVSYHSLLCWGISVTMRLRRINNLPHLRLFLLRQINLSRGKVFFQSLRLGRARNCNQTLGSYPSERDLSNGATLARSELLNLIDNSAILVEVLALEFGNCTEQRFSSCSSTWLEVCLPLRRKSSGAKSSGVLNGKSSTSQP